MGASRRQMAGIERAIGEQAQAGGPHDRKHLALKLLHAVLAGVRERFAGDGEVLFEAGDGGLAGASRQGDELAYLRCGVVGGAPIPDLAALHQRVHGADDFLGRCTGVRLVEQVEIEVVGTEPPEAIFPLAGRGSRG